MSKDNKGIKLIANNKKAYFDYFIDEEIECGIVLKGSEIKSIRNGLANLKDCYAIEKNGCIYINMFENYEEIGIDPKKDFFDESHLNEVGAIKVADYFSRFILDKYDMTDMREVPGNIWEK